MIDKINQSLCVGCRACVRICPLDTLRMNEKGRAFIAYPEDCMTCFMCERVCPAGAIDVSPIREELPAIFPKIPIGKGGGAA